MPSCARYVMYLKLWSQTLLWAFWWRRLHSHICCKNFLKVEKMSFSQHEQNSMRHGASVEALAKYVLFISWVSCIQMCGFSEWAEVCTLLSVILVFPYIIVNSLFSFSLWFAAFALIFILYCLMFIVSNQINSLLVKIFLSINRGVRSEVRGVSRRKHWKPSSVQETPE